MIFCYAIFSNLCSSGGSDTILFRLSKNRLPGEAALRGPTVFTEYHPIAPDPSHSFSSTASAPPS